MEDLEIHVDQQLRKQAAAAISKASRILAVIRRSFALLYESTLPLLFRAMVRPHLEYTNSIWEPFNREDQRRVKKGAEESHEAGRHHPKSAVRGEAPDSRLAVSASLYHRRRRVDMITVYQVLRPGIDLETRGGEVLRSSTDRQAPQTGKHSRTPMGADENEGHLPGAGMSMSSPFQSV